MGVGFDEMFDALGAVQRRRVLVELLESPEDPLRGITDPETETETEFVGDTVRMAHVHLPKLDDYGFIDWNEDADVVRTLLDALAAADECEPVELDYALQAHIDVDALVRGPRPQRDRHGRRRRARRRRQRRARTPGVGPAPAFGGGTPRVASSDVFSDTAHTMGSSVGLSVASRRDVHTATALGPRSEHGKDRSREQSVTGRYAIRSSSTASPASIHASGFSVS